LGVGDELAVHGVGEASFEAAQRSASIAVLDSASLRL
jgi:hypothetical protein